MRIAIRLNELENVEGELWANLWPTETIIRIDPKSGRILVSSVLNRSLPLCPAHVKDQGWVDLRGLRRECEKIAGPMKQLDVLNGIAFHKGSQGRKLIVTGKWWPRSFEIELVGSSPTCTAKDGDYRQEAACHSLAWPPSRHAGSGEVALSNSISRQIIPEMNFGD